MFGYSSSSFNTSATDNFVPRLGHSSIEPPDWGHHSAGSRNNLLFDVDSYPAAMRSTGYGSTQTSFPNDVRAAASEQIGARWSAHFQPENHSINSAFFPNPPNQKADLNEHCIGNGFSGQTGCPRPDRLTGSVGIPGAGRSFTLPLAREAIASVDWPNT